MTYVISILPQNAISKAAGKFASSSISRLVIKPFARKFSINVQEAELPLQEYKTLNAFFTRKLKVGARLIDMDKESIVSPVDGTIAQFGNIQNGRIIQAKGIHYSVEELIGKEKSKLFKDGHFMTIYLSPKDYHRIHTPMTGKIEEYEYIPGRLFPVNKLGVQHVNGLFTKNERLTTYLSDKDSQIALVKVGAFIVGSVQLSYEENVHQLHRGEPYKGIGSENLILKKGEEIGLFEFGSTVILLFNKNTMVFTDDLQSGISLKMGQKIGNRI